MDSNYYTLHFIGGADLIISIKNDGIDPKENKALINSCLNYYKITSDSKTKEIKITIIMDQYFTEVDKYLIGLKNVVLNKTYGNEHGLVMEKDYYEVTYDKQEFSENVEDTVFYVMYTFKYKNESDFILKMSEEEYKGEIDNA